MNKLFLDDRNILIIILVNAVLIFLGGFDLSRGWAKFVDYADNIVTILFVIELYIKLKSYGIKSFFSSYWNIFDFVLVALSIPSFVLSFFDVKSTALSFILVFRVMRVFKSFRFLRFIPGISRIIAGIKRAVKASIIVLLAFIVYVFIVGIVSFNLFQNKSPEHFGNPLKAMYSTFKTFTVEGWYEIPEAIIAGEGTTSSFWVLLYFVAILLSGGILGLSLVNSIFVDAMVSDNNDDISKKIDNLEIKLNQLIKSRNDGT
ncbi:ion transporter [Capnocytophaga canis]|uniref:ion transporter n=1 Tax=Capnocytophaga canis TaxID=1848903 RepID=UPI00370D9405